AATHAAAGCPSPRNSRAERNLTRSDAECVADIDCSDRVDAIALTWRILGALMQMKTPQSNAFGTSKMTRFANRFLTNDQPQQKKAVSGGQCDGSATPNRFFKAHTILLPLLLVLCSLPALAQIVPTASLDGAVTDPSGANIPSANVEIVNTGTRVTKQMNTDAQGRFGFKFLLPGSYELNV